MPRRPDGLVPMVPVEARIGDKTLALGWRLHHNGPWLWHPEFGFPLAWGCCPELYVFPDGRGYLRASPVV
jgi:hypothetical protein